MDDQTVLCFIRYFNICTGEMMWRIGSLSKANFLAVKETVLDYPLRLSKGLIMTCITEIQLIKPKFEPAY